MSQFIHAKRNANSKLVKSKLRPKNYRSMVSGFLLAIVFTAALSVFGLSNLDTNRIASASNGGIQGQFQSFYPGDTEQVKNVNFVYDSSTEKLSWQGFYLQDVSCEDQLQSSVIVSGENLNLSVRSSKDGGVCSQLYSYTTFSGQQDLALTPAQLAKFGALFKVLVEAA